jgi:protein gp37
MSDHTHIEWTDATWNIITGCSVVSAGCKHCYAMKLAGTRLQHHPSRVSLTTDTAAGPVWNGQVRFNEEWLDQPMRWKNPRRIFVCAHGDLFHESVPDHWIDRVFAVMALTPRHTFQVLTKRADRMNRYLRDSVRLRGRVLGVAWEMLGHLPKYKHEGITERAFPLANVWVGVSVEHQEAANKRIHLLLQTPAAVRWVSAEPLLGPVRLDRLERRSQPVNASRDQPDDRSDWTYIDDALTGFQANKCGGTTGAKLDWVVCGGESGTNARPMHPDWARALRDQCAAAGVAFLFKQWGAWGPAYQKGGGLVDYGPTRERQLNITTNRLPNGMLNHVVSNVLVGKKLAGRLLDGVQHDGYPVTP